MDIEQKAHAHAPRLVRILNAIAALQGAVALVCLVRTWNNGQPVSWPLTLVFLGLFAGAVTFAIDPPWQIFRLAIALCSTALILSAGLLWLMSA